MPLDYLPYLFFLIALFYSSVGFGGGSSYLAILSLVLTDFYEIRATALLLNVFVVAIGTLVYMKNGILKPKLMWPFLILSIPLAFLGSQIQLSQTLFFLLLGVALILAGLSMVLRYFEGMHISEELSKTKKILLGGGIGLLSGVSGIGGGIFLSPALHFLKWKNARIIASLASVFILVNSIAGLVGLHVAGTLTLSFKLVYKLLIAVVLGGSIGSYLSSKKFNLNVLLIGTACLVLYVGIKLILLHGFGIRI